MLPSLYNREGGDPLSDRKRQIDTLKAFNERVTTVQEDVEYKIDVSTNAGGLCLGVHLPPEFPNVKPIMTISPPVMHPWVTNNTDITNAPGILNYTIHSDLGRVVNAIVREWQVRPPQIKTGPTPAIENPMPILPVSEEFPSLTTLPASALQNINNNTDRLEEFVATLPHWRSWDNAVKAKIAEIEEIARDTLSKEDALTDLRHQVEEKVSEAQTKKSECEDKARELAVLSEAYEPEHIRGALHSAAVESDHNAENIAEKFLAGDIDVDQFLMDYVETRKMSQIRKSKEEKLGNQLRDLHRAGF